MEKALFDFLSALINDLKGIVRCIFNIILYSLAVFGGYVFAVGNHWANPFLSGVMP